MTFDPKILAQVARCFYFLPRRELKAAEIYLLCQWAQSPGVNPLVQDWIQGVIDNGGEIPSQKTQDALNDFADDLDDAGLTSKMLAVNCIVPDSLAAAQVPLIHVKGNAVWTNSPDPPQGTPHTDADLTFEGLVGQSADPPKYLETGFNPHTDLDNSNSFGMTLYSTDADTNTRADFAAIVDDGVNPDKVAQLLTGYGINAYFFCFGSANLIGAAGLLDSRGYTSGNRTSATDVALYIANDSVPHQLIASSNVPVVDARPNLTIPLGTWNRNGNYALACTIKRFSFAAIHLGLTEAESAAFFTAIQKMRKALGGGWV